jgi:hypothetical protein
MRTRVPSRWIRAAMAAALAFASSCDEPTALKLTDLTGDWNLVHLNRTFAANGVTLDAVDGTWTMVMSVATDGSVTTVTTTSGASPVNGTGTIDLATNKMVLDGQEYFGHFILRGNELTVSCGPQLGLDEYSQIVFVFTRQ